MHHYGHFAHVLGSGRLLEQLLIPVNAPCANGGRIECVQVKQGCMLVLPIQLRQDVAKPTQKLLLFLGAVFFQRCWQGMRGVMRVHAWVDARKTATTSRAMVHKASKGAGSGGEWTTTNLSLRSLCPA